MVDVHPSLFSGHYYYIDFERKFYRRLATRDELHSPNLTYTTFMDICDEIEPSLIFGTGSIMFELYVLRFGSDKHRALLRRQIRENPGIPLDPLDHEEILKKYSLLFYFECISKLPLVNRNCNTQLFLLTLALEYRGLSRLGIQFLALFGAAANPRTFDRKRNVELEKYDKALKLHIDKGEVVFGMDNFCHSFWNSRIETGKKNSIKSANVMVGAVSIPQVILPNEIRYTLQGNIIPSVPTEKVTLACYVRAFLNDLKRVLWDIKDKTGDFYTYWPVSRVVRQNITTIPASAQFDQVNVSGQPDENKDHARGLRNFRPWFVSGDNPSSNFGALNSMLRLFKEALDVLNRRYLYVRIDVDLYMKWLRVLTLILLISD